MNTPRDNKTKYRPHAVSITFRPLMLDKVKAGAAMMGTPLDTFIQCAAYRAAEKAADSPAGRKWIDKTKGEMAADDCNASLEAWTRYALLHTARLALEDKESREIMETARARREHRQDGGKVNA